MRRKPVSQSTKKKISNSLRSRFGRRKQTEELPIKRTNYTAIGSGLGATLGGVGTYLAAGAKFDMLDRHGALSPSLKSSKRLTINSAGVVGSTLGAAGGALAGKGLGRVKRAKTRLGKAVGLGLMGTGLATAGLAPGSLSHDAYRWREV
jgi:hypothetical protein